MVDVRKPRSFGADGWLKIETPNDVDVEWFRRVRNIVTASSPVSETAHLEPAEIAPGIFLGSAEHARDAALLNQLGVTYVLNCATATETQTGRAFYGENNGIEYLELGATDDEISELVEPYLRSVVEFVDSAQSNGTGILVHCVKGINRSPALCAAYMMARNRTPLLTAIRAVWEQRPIVLTNEAFCRELTTLARKQGLLEAPSLQSAPVTVARRGRPVTLGDLMG